MHVATGGIREVPMPPRRARSVLARALVLLARGAALGGCPVNVPMSTPVPPAGHRIVVRLTDRGSVELARHVGPSIGELDGRVVAADERQLTLSLISATTWRGIPSYWAGEEVIVERDFIAGMTERRLSRTRSWILTAGIVTAALVAATVGAVGGKSGGGGGDDGSGQQ